MLNDELIKEVIEKGEKCLYYNDKYVILYKEMESRDEDLEEYLSRLKKAKELGISTPIVIEYKLLARSINSLKTKGIFVEERAPGKVLKVRGKILHKNKDYDFNDVIVLYLKNSKEYLEELQKRALAPQNMYTKLVKDFIDFQIVGLKPDPNSLNFLFDEKKGYTIIDPYMLESNIYYDDKSIIKYIINGVYGVARPKILIKDEKLEEFTYLPTDLKRQLDYLSNLINNKLIVALKSNLFLEKDILEVFSKNTNRWQVNNTCDYEDLEKNLEEQFSREKILPQTRK